MKTHYKFKFYLNARHSVTFDDKTSNIHPHTWEIAVIFTCKQSDTVNFSVFEKELEENFLLYEGKYLNELEAFKNQNPTMEGIGKVFYSSIKSIVNNIDLFFETLEISENPTRTYIIEAD